MSIVRAASIDSLPYVGDQEIISGYSGETLIYDGIPRSGLVCWHDLYDPTESLASVPDLSGNGYSLQRGSTDGEDSKDPAWGTDGKGLVHTTDDYCLTGDLSGVDMTGDWTVVLAGKFNGTSGRLLSLGTLPGNETNVRYVGSGISVNSINPTEGWGTSSATLMKPAIGVLCVRRSSGVLYLSRCDTGATSSTAARDVLGTPTLYIAADIRGIVNIADALTAYQDLVYNRALSNAEIQRIYRSLKAMWAARGVTIL